MIPQNLELLTKHRITIPKGMECLSIEAGNLFNFLGKNNGLTEEFIYNNENPLYPQIPVYTASFEPIGELPINSLKDGRPLKTCNGEVIIIFRQGYAGLMYIPKESMFFASEHTIPIQVKDEYKDFLNQRWFAKYYQPDVMHYVTGKADSGNFSQLAFEKMTFLIPERVWQDECAALYQDLEKELNDISKSISGISLNPANTNGKGLSDQELVAKYEMGESKSFNKIVTKLIKTPNPEVTKKGKSKKR